MRKTVMLVLISTLVTAAPDVYAQATPTDVAMAKDFFEQGMEAMRAKDYAKACPLLADSDHLDPLPSTKGNLAVCYEHLGRIASAWKLFEAVAAAYQDQGDEKLANFAQEHANDLRPRLPRIKIVLPPGSAASGLKIERDGETVEEMYLGKEVPVDPGAHTIKASAVGKKTWETSESVAERAVIVVTIPVLEDLPKSDQTPSLPSDKVIQPQAPNWGLRGTAIGLGVVGLAGVVIGSITGASAMAKWDPDIVKNQCIDTKTNKCDDDAIALSQEVGTLSSTSTATLIGGGVSLAAAGVFWYLSRPAPQKPASTGVIVLPSVAPGHLSALVHVQF
ncbi:MAG: hypothetical protein IPM54_19370 [Polyangiaceae bacterium]|nr:hypothetical protein [Polyangiaceae bacterium]